MATAHRPVQTRPLTHLPRALWQRFRRLPVGRRDLLLLVALGVLARGVTAALIHHPGYIDAAYYYDVARNVAQGCGLTEDFIITYLVPTATLRAGGALLWAGTSGPRGGAPVAGRCGGRVGVGLIPGGCAAGLAPRGAAVSPHGEGGAREAVGLVSGCTLASFSRTGKGEEGSPALELGGVLRALSHRDGAVVRAQPAAGGRAAALGRSSRGVAARLQRLLQLSAADHPGDLPRVGSGSHSRLETLPPGVHRPFAARRDA